MASSIRRIVGTMTGTSIDAIDSALMQIDGVGLDLRATLASWRSDPLGPIQTGLRNAAEQVPMTARDFAELSWTLGEAIADSVRMTIDQAGIERPDLVVVHGQTVVHRPPISWQLVNVHPIAARLGCRVVHDLRQADLAAGGQGAPITPLADWILFRDDDRSRAIVNLGGFCNATILPRATVRNPIEQIAGFDVCACNQVLDAVARSVLDAPFDADGQAALAGRPDAGAASVLADVLFDQRRSARSLGTGDEAGAWIECHRDRLARNDLAASAVEAIATTIVAALGRHDVDEILLAGGGARNAALIDRIEHHATRGRSMTGGVRTTDIAGIPITVREAAGMAVLGALADDRVSITLPQVTRRGEVGRDGAWVNLP